MPSLRYLHYLLFLLWPRQLQEGLVGLTQQFLREGKAQGQECEAAARVSFTVRKEMKALLSLLFPIPYI